MRFERFQKCRKHHTSQPWKQPPSRVGNLSITTWLLLFENAARVNAVEASVDILDHIPKPEVEFEPTKE